VQAGRQQALQHAYGGGMTIFSGGIRRCCVDKDKVIHRSGKSQCECAVGLFLSGICNLGRNGAVVPAGKIYNQ